MSELAFELALLSDNNSRHCSYQQSFTTEKVIKRNDFRFNLRIILSYSGEVEGVILHHFMDRLSVWGSVNVWWSKLVHEEILLNMH